MLQLVKLPDYKSNVPSSIPEPNGGGKKTPLSYPLEEEGGCREDLGSIPAPMWRLRPDYNSSSRDLTLTQIYMQGNTNAHKTRSILKNAIHQSSRELDSPRE